MPNSPNWSEDIPMVPTSTSYSHTSSPQSNALSDELASPSPDPRQPVTTVHICSVCQQPATFMCSACGREGPRYCSTECQTNDWDRHQTECRGSGAARENDAGIRVDDSAESSAVRRPAGRGNVAQIINTRKRRKMYAHEGHSPQTGGQHHSENGVDPSAYDPDMIEEFKFYMEQIYLIIRPVVVCIVLSILWVKIANSGKSSYRPVAAYQVFTETSSTTTSEQFLGSLANAGIIIGQIILVTIIIVCLFKHGFIKILVGFFMIVVLMLLGFMTYLLILNLIQVFAIPLDYPTLIFCLWNFAVVGLISVFYKAPLWLQQIYLTILSSLMAFALTALYEWTTWILLALLAIWDLIAVLCPFGPLRILVESSRQQQRDVPALLYSVNAVWLMATPAHHPSSQLDSLAENSTPLVDEGRVVVNQRRSDGFAPLRDGNASGPDLTGRPEQNEERRQEEGEGRNREAEEEEEEDEERNGLKLGLGDFVFYSVLIARAALYDWITTVCCSVAVLTGLAATIFLLAMYQKALPALPISIALGMLFYFISRYVLVPFVGNVASLGMVIV
ncbi:uncharacterized protein VTP21DRAFT_640 [Calcarisporiella thermophila]|uniref:uncharacterized protein n=1 Tax=Calcarisporiella thermophila TaxID=911321 RepID=UPI0037433132